ncbi:MAG: 2-amino-4-hydroxy-6-hydroxymethyldihydropteridine diphosphokinase [Lentisphaeria bacterium]|nr:2-amino-4-hydroxy-6-hydroxymethyldihydropteridine diphosphokinase [Lentisphaeria bacterium]
MKNPQKSKNMNEIAIMLGGDLPGTAEAMAVALEKFAAAGVTGLRSGKAVVSAAEDCEPGTPDFLDMAVYGQWAGTPEELLSLCQRIEREAGRPAEHSSREARILDCDIIIFGALTLNTPNLTIPHPRARQRFFVLEPLAALAPEMRFPDGVTAAEALKSLRIQHGAIISGGTVTPETSA